MKALTWLEGRSLGLLFCVLTVLLSLVSDGWAGKPSPFLHQIYLLPATLLFLSLLSSLFSSGTVGSEKFQPRVIWCTLIGLELWSALLFQAEARHFRQFGYAQNGEAWSVFVVAVFVGCVFAYVSNGGFALIQAGLVAYSAGLLLAIHGFPLNYLRSDMLPVIGWADQRLLHHLNPYATMHVASRLYDFPYLPGMLVAFLPAVLCGIDLRWVNLACVWLLTVIVYRTSRPESRSGTAILLCTFLCCPFLQYRHDLYLQPHWLAVVAATALMQKRRFLWSGFIWGVSAALYQLSWVLIPFVLLYGFRRSRWREVVKVLSLLVTGFALIVGPFLPFAMHRIVNNSVGQWNRMPHALAEPINLSYWITYLVRPDELRWVQACLLTGLFVVLLIKKRCATLEDTLRWMCIALALFISTNVLVDGYFYLTLLLLVLLYVCVAEGWWKSSEPTRFQDYYPPSSVLQS